MDTSTTWTYMKKVSLGHVHGYVHAGMYMHAAVATSGRRPHPRLWTRTWHRRGVEGACAAWRHDLRTSGGGDRRGRTRSDTVARKKEGTGIQQSPGDRRTRSTHSGAENTLWYAHSSRNATGANKGRLHKHQTRGKH